MHTIFKTITVGCTRSSATDYNAISYLGVVCTKSVCHKNSIYFRPSWDTDVVLMLFLVSFLRVYSIKLLGQRPNVSVTKIQNSYWFHSSQLHRNNC